MKIKCAFCGCTTDKPTGHVNRSRARGAPVYCGRQCAGSARRAWKSDAQKRSEKQAYDITYREKNSERIKERKRAYHKLTYDPISAAYVRKRRSHLHAAYCRRPEYKQWKQAYDRQYRASKEFAEFADAFLLLQDIDREIAQRATKYEIYLASNRLNKALKRRRDYGRIDSSEP